MLREPPPCSADLESGSELELLRETVPKSFPSGCRSGIRPIPVFQAMQLRETEAAAQALGIHASDACRRAMSTDIDRGFAIIAKEHVRGAAGPR